jgi:sugar phosphate isomerase/epimerase
MGSFPIAFRRSGAQWQHDTSSLAAWAKQAGFDAIDLGRATAEDVATLRSNGLKVGSVDLIEFGRILAADPGQRKAAIEANIAYIKQAAALGARAFFTCIVPADPAAKRADNYRIAVETYQPIAAACASVGGALAVEGWPGWFPYFANLMCTPETVRAFLKDVGPGAGLNYDPSHLIRLGVDHIRFVQEFAPHVKHVHGKDTELSPEALYEFGTQPAVFAPAHGCGEWIWRYTIPGHGQTRWLKAFQILKSAGYSGIVSVELEDENFNGTEDGEKRGLTHALEFLRGV